MEDDRLRAGTEICQSATCNVGLGIADGLLRIASSSSSPHIFCAHRISNAFSTAEFWISARFLSDQNVESTSRAQLPSIATESQP